MINFKNLLLTLLLAPTFTFPAQTEVKHAEKSIVEKIGDVTIRDIVTWPKRVFARKTSDETKWAVAAGITGGIALHCLRQASRLKDSVVRVAMADIDTQCRSFNASHNFERLNLTAEEITENVNKMISYAFYPAYNVYGFGWVENPRLTRYKDAAFLKNCQTRYLYNAIGIPAAVICAYALYRWCSEKYFKKTPDQNNSEKQTN